MKRLAPAALLTLGLGGCVQPELVDIRQAATGTFARCELPVAEGAASIPATLFRSTSSRACPADLAAAGWERVQPAPAAPPAPVGFPVAAPPLVGAPVAAP